MEKVGCRVKIYLKNEHGVLYTLHSYFNNEVEFKINIYSCEKNTDKLLKILERHQKYNQKWKTLLNEEDLIIFKTEDSLGNKNYLHIDFREEK